MDKMHKPAIVQLHLPVVHTVCKSVYVTVTAVLVVTTKPLRLQVVQAMQPHKSHSPRQQQRLKVAKLVYQQPQVIVTEPLAMSLFMQIINLLAPQPIAPIKPHI